MCIIEKERGSVKVGVNIVYTILMYMCNGYCIPGNFRGYKSFMDVPQKKLYFCGGTPRQTCTTLLDTCTYIVHDVTTNIPVKFPRFYFAIAS